MLLALLACGPKLPTTTLQIDGHSVRVEIASTPEARARGLMHRDSLGTDRGMLFVYPDEQVRTFWMKDTRIPLSIAFADRSGKIVRIADMRPFDTESTSSLYPSKYALEVEKGWFAKKGIERGAKIAGIPEGIEVK